MVRPYNLLKSTQICKLKHRPVVKYVLYLVKTYRLNEFLVLANVYFVLKCNKVVFVRSMSLCTRGQ